MKKLLLALLFVFVMVMPAMAADLPSVDLGTSGVAVGLNNMSAGTYYDVRHRAILAGAQVSAVDFKKIISLDIGVLTDAHSTPWLIGIGVDASTIAEKLNLNYNLPGSLHLGVFVARDLTLGWADGGKWGFDAIVRF